MTRPHDPARDLALTLTVADVMHRGVVTCSASADLGEVAEAMAVHAIHCVVAIDEGPPAGDDDRLWGVVSDLDLLRGLRSAADLDAGNLADLEVVTVAPEDALAAAADTMLRRGVAHLVVVSDGRPVGVLSTLDIARAVHAKIPYDAALGAHAPGTVSPWP